MNNFILGFIFTVLTARFFTETISVLPKGIDLIDLLVIPLILLLAVGAKQPHGIDMNLHRRLLHLSVAYFFLCLLSAAVNFDRVHFGPFLLFVFGILEGPILYLGMNKLISDKRKFGNQVAKFINVMLIIQVLVVVFINYPLLITTGNPDKMSGTFGNNSYQFTALLIIIGGFLIGRQFANPRSMWYAVGVQFFVILTFLLLQYRTAVPAFFLSYAVLVTVLYGGRFMKMLVIAIPIGFVVFIGFRQISRSSLDLKYEDLITLSQDLSVIMEYGKFQSYSNTVMMFAENPAAILFGTGPGTYVSRANYTFTMELQVQGKGVGPIITKIFGDQDYASDVYTRYIVPLYSMESLFGSVQINNPNSSFLAVMAETGLVGLFLMGSIYATVVISSRRYLGYAIARRDPVLLPLASALFIGTVYLCLISPLDNYLEISRVTLPIWLLFWTVSTFVRQKRAEEEQMLYMAMLRQQEEEAQYQLGGDEEPDPYAGLPPGARPGLPQ